MVRVALGVLFASALAISLVSCSTRDFQVKRGVVRVSTVDRSHSGTGFFIAGPDGDEKVYVATAFHVVSSGMPVIVESLQEISDRDSYVVAYPENQVAVYDPTADLAILEVKNVPRAHVTTLPLAEQALKDERVVSYGFPVSNLTQEMGLVKKDGTILNNAAKLPYFDFVQKRTIRDNAADGLIVSVDIEGGFSGGPTCNVAGEVVGINVQKDQGHTGQNAAISVAHLRGLVARLQAPAEPTKEQIAAALGRLRDELLLLPVEERIKIPIEIDFLSISERADIARMVAEVMKLEADTKMDSESKLSPRAIVGLLFARLPGKLLETYRSEHVQKQLNACRKRSAGLRRWLGELVDGSDDATELDDCADVAFRPLAWDLIAATLQWQGRAVDYNVSKVEVIDPRKHIYRANVSIGGAPTVVPLTFAWDYGQLRLRLFNEEGRVQFSNPYNGTSTRDLEGSWVTKTTKSTLEDANGAVREHTERLEIAFVDSAATVRHVVTNKLVTLDSTYKFTCNKKTTQNYTAVQALSGKFENGALVVYPAEGIKRSGDCGSGAAYYSEDTGAVLKLLDGRLLMYRTSGQEFPEVQEFTRG